MKNTNRMIDATTPELERLKQNIFMKAQKSANESRVIRKVATGRKKLNKGVAPTENVVIDANTRTVVDCEYCFDVKRFVATHENYDGASDGHNSMGFGATEKEAIDDLTQKLAGL